MNVCDISVLPKRNIVIPSPDGKTSVRLDKDILTRIPNWAAKTPYFKALAADQKLLVIGGKKDKDLEKAKKAAEEAARKAAEEEREAVEEADAKEDSGGK